MDDYNKIFGGSSDAVGGMTEEEKKKKKLQESQVATQQQKDTSNYDRIFGNASTTTNKIQSGFPQETKVQPIATPTPAKKPSLWDNIKTGVSKIVSSINPRNTFPGVAPTTTPDTTSNTTSVKSPEYNNQLDQYMKFPNFFPNPDYSLPKESTSATFTPEAMKSPAMQTIQAGQDATVKFLSNPVDGVINATADFLTYHPKVKETLDKVSYDIENFEYKDPLTGRVIPAGITNNPLNYAIVKSVSDMFLGSSRQVKDTFNTKLIKPVAPKGQEGVYATYDTVGQLVGSVYSYWVGGAVLKSLGLAKLTLPVLFATLGQTSAEPDTTLTQRIEKLPVDVAAGWIFSKIPALKPGGLSPANIQTLIKGTGIATGVGGTSGFLDAIIKGATKEEALKLGATQAVIMALFHIVATGTGLLSDEILNNKVQTKSAVFTPDDLRKVAASPIYDGSPARENINKLANSAESQGKNVSIDAEQIKQGLLYDKLKWETIPVTSTDAKGNVTTTDVSKFTKMKVSFVDKAPDLGAGTPTTTENGTIVPPSDQVGTTKVGTSVSTPKLDIQPLGEDTPVFRGAKDQTVDTTMANGITGGVSTSLTKDVAQRFADKNGGTVKDYTISKDANVVNHSDLEAAVADIPVKEKTAAVQTIIKDNKIDVVKFDVAPGQQGEAELRVVNADVLKPVEAPKVEPTTRLTAVETAKKAGIEKPATDKFYINTSGEGFSEVKGKSVPIVSNIETFVHKSVDGKEWVVTEGKSGMLVASGATQTMAINEAQRLLTEHKGKVEDLISSAVERSGLSPRYGGATMKANETNNGAGATNRPGQRTSPVSNGQEPQGGTNKAVEKPNGEVGGNGKGGNNESGKRSGEAITSAKDAAKDLIRVYVTRGDTLQSLKDGGTGAFTDKYAATIGGYVGNKRISPDKIIVTNVNGKNLEPPEVFSLKALYDEIKAEGETARIDVTTSIVDQLPGMPEEMQNEANDDWINNYAEIYKLERNTKVQNDLEKAFVNKWQQKLVEYNKPSKASAVQQVDINKQVEDLVALNKDFYTDAEKTLLRQYSGAGGLEKAGAEGRGLLDEYYTPKPMVDFIWSRLKTMDLPESPDIIEPAAGIGGFFEKAPDNSVKIGFEISKTASKIAKILYPDASINNKPFESLFIDDRGNPIAVAELADLVVGNPPYGEHRGKYLGLGEEPKIVKYEDYFMKRGLDILKKDGVMAYVIPSSFLRSPSYYAKEQIGKLGRLEEAFRLPNGVFGTTSMGTDIVFFRKGGLTDPEFLSNDRYFTEFPKNVLGEISKGTGNYGKDEVTGTLENAIKKVQGQPVEVTDAVPDDELADVENAEKTELETAGVQVEKVDPQLAEMRKSTLPAFNTSKEIVNLDAFVDKIRKLDPKSEADQIWYEKGARIEVTVSYPHSLGEMGNQIDIHYDTLPTVSELAKDIVEEYQTTKATINEELATGIVAKSGRDENIENKIDIVLAQTKIPPANRVPESPVITDAVNKKAQIIPGKKDSLVNISNVTGDDLKLWQSVSVTGELNSSFTAGFDAMTFTSPQVSIDVSSGETKYYPNVIYQQGNIYEKLDNLELFKDKISPAQYETQKTALEEILPTPQSLIDTTLPPNSDFVRELQLSGEGSVLQLFRDFMHGLPWESFGGSSSWEVEGYLNGSTVNTGDKLQNAEIRKRRRDVGNSLFKRFMQEVLTPEQKSYIEDRYNRQFNAYHKPDYAQVPVLSPVNATFNPKGKPGKHPLELYPHQREGAAFLATKGVGLLAHDVGLGKTLTAIVGINDVLKRGWAKRPLVVVPNGVYRNWIKEISEVIPDVKINSLMNLGAAFKGDLKTLQIEDGTISLITYDGLVKLGFKPETYDGLTADLKDVMIGMNNTKRAAAKEEAGIEQQVGKAIRGTTGDRFFEDLGFDHLTIDEVQNFKNIFAGAKLQRGQGNEYRNVRGSSSARGIKAYLMSQYILKNNGDRNIFLLSATPFTNSPLEIYSILSLMGKARLEQIGLKNVNDFMSMFVELKPSFVVKADQSVKEEDVIEKFQNLQQLQKLVTEFIDFRTGEEINIARPGKEKRTITLSPTETQNDYVSQAQALFNDKDKGGAIVAITELQNITLSPYLSRYNDHRPTAIEFVDNSPKIKYAVEAVAQTYKDNKNVGQIIYMPRGVDKFPLLREYLVKEKGFKTSQIGEITGGMTIDAKQKVQNDFNSGSIKVLIGTEAIKEGVNLQERATDLYHLHLPWNPTDMIQVEGRLWRQGNEWANVRIHYPLIENSVDSFIFQKLETKEKRIKNLWNYKSNDVEVGGLDFENMKLDLITNPVMRVTAEKTFETKKESQKLEQLKVEKSFADRKIIKIQKIEEDLKYAEDRIVKSRADNDEADVKYYKAEITQQKTALTNAKRDLVQKGIDITDLEKKSKEMQVQIDDQQKVVENLDKKFEPLIKEAETKKETLVSKPNNWAQYIQPIANENKSFFVKVAGKPTVQGSNYTSPGGNADIGGYADIASTEKTVGNLKGIEFPELLRMAKQLTGNTPTLKGFRRALGRFYETGNGMIKLNPAIFKDPKLAAKVFAHELGHLADYLPDQTLKRGNIIGRLNSLNKYLKGTFGDKEITNAEIRAELKDLSQLWKPFDELENPNFTAYRFSAKELYADAISVLFNDPALLQEQAPQFYKEFFDNLENKPEVMEVYNEIQDILNKGDEALFQERRKEMLKDFATGEEKQKADLLDKMNRKTNLIYMLQSSFVNKNAAINNKVAEALKKGARIEDTANPLFEQEGLSYFEGKLKNLLSDWFQGSYAKAAEVTDGWDSMGEILQLERAIYERGELANPGGYDPATAQTQLDQIEKHTSPEDWAKIQEAKTLFRKGVKDAVQYFNDNEFYSPELITQMAANPAYATFQVLDYITENLSSKIYKQVGTLKGIANPATSTVVKMMVTAKAIEYNNAKKVAMQFHREQFPEEIEVAKSVFDGKKREFIEPKEYEKGLVLVIEHGKLAGYYVSADVAHIFNNTPAPYLQAAAKISRLLGGRLYRPLFTTINLGFQTYNFVKDFERAWRSMPHGDNATFGELLMSPLTDAYRLARGYAKAAKPSKNRVLDREDPLIKEMENSKILSMTYNDMFYSADTEEKQIQRVFEKAGVLHSTRKRNIMTPIYKVLDAITILGDFIESLPKVASYIELKGSMPKNALAHYIRTKAGSPSFVTGGGLTPATNNILLFSNAIIQGNVTDFGTAAFSSSTNKKTRAAWWWKTMIGLIPKFLMIAGSIGLLGKWVKDRLADASEYDKTNYDIIPVGVDKNGKTIYIRVPGDEWHRMIGGLTWKLSHFATGQDTEAWFQNFFDLFSFGAGQLPNTVPSITGISAIITYLSGKNPYDSYRDRNVIPDTVFAAGVKESFPYFMGWLLQNQGLGIVIPSFTPSGELTTMEKILNLPVLSNIIGRWVKVSNYGQTEQLNAISADVAQGKAETTIQNDNAIDAAVKQYQASDKSIESRVAIERQLVKDRVGTSLNSDQAAEANRLVKKFQIAVIKGKNDINANAIISAPSNDAKVELFKAMHDKMGEQEFRDFVNMLRSQGVISNEMITRLKTEIQ